MISYRDTLNRLYLSATLSLFGIVFSGQIQAELDDSMQIHGFLSQAYILSDGNNFYGDSQKGSTDFMEAGVNGSWRASAKLNLAAQIITRDAGSTDNGDIKIDFMFADLKILEHDLSGLGVRIGRVRNSFGFYNEARDVLFTRPTILMPQAVYFEGNGVRELLFASDGAQLYSYWDDEDASTSLSLTMGRSKSISQDVVRNILGSASALFNKADIENPVFTQISHTRDGGSTRFALSTLDITLTGESIFGPQNNIRLDVNGFALSAQKNLANWTFTGEYALYTIDTQFGANSSTTKIESAYLQTQYRIGQDIILTGRYEKSVLDKKRPNETDSHHLVAGVKWMPTPAWVIAADIYGIRGTAGIPAIDNVNSPLRERTEILAIMVGYRF
jgi:hypothetical protein